MRIAFIGLGTMGWPMAAHLAALHEVTVCNRTAAKARAWAAAHTGIAAASVAEAVANADAVLVCLPTDADTQAVAAGAFPAMRTGAVFVDHGSGTPEVARLLAAAAEERGLAYLDAPVTGGRAGAEAGSLGVLAGGDAAVLARVEPALRCFASEVRLMGGAGAGHTTKLVNVIIGHGNGVALAEGLGFAIRAGLDPSLVVAALLPGSSRSWQLEHRAGPMIARDFRTLYPVGFARKDLGNAIAEAGRCGARLPLSRMADGLYATLESRGYGAADAASLIDFFAPLHDEAPLA